MHRRTATGFMPMIWGKILIEDGVQPGIFGDEQRNSVLPIGAGMGGKPDKGIKIGRYGIQCIAFLKETLEGRMDRPCIL